MQDQIIVAVFPSGSNLRVALDYLVEEATADIQRAAVVVRSKTGEILILDDKMGSDEGGLVGGGLGAVLTASGMMTLGLWALPAQNIFLVITVGVLLGGTLGWILGGLVVRAFHNGFAQETVEALAGKLQTGKPALMLRVKDAAKVLPRLRDELKGAEIIDEFIDLI